MANSDPFLDEFGVTDELTAMKDALESALRVRRGLQVYRNAITEKDKKKFLEDKNKFVEDWKALIRQEAQQYVCPSYLLLFLQSILHFMGGSGVLTVIKDKQHCDAIERIAGTLSNRWGSILHGDPGHLRFGISQKAFNLYLKYLWRLRKITKEPPHCPIDEIVLRIGGLAGSWTKSDNREQYMDWIDWLRMRAQRKNLTLSVWEYTEWWAEYQKRKKSTAEP